MILTNTQALIMIAVMAVMTFCTRALPFALFPAGKTPKYIAYLGRVLPYAIIGMLIIYCLKDVRLLAAPHGAPELISLAVVTALYLARRNSLIAIAGGTVLYMVLVQTVFA